eukprot:8171591-Lingulodinium_polyedra.AAC.1
MGMILQSALTLRRPAPRPEARCRVGGAFCLLICGAAVGQLASGGPGRAGVCARSRPRPGRR